MPMSVYTLSLGTFDFRSNIVPPNYNFRILAKTQRLFNPQMSRIFSFLLCSGDDFSNNRPYYPGKLKINTALLGVPFLGTEFIFASPSCVFCCFTSKLREGGRARCSLSQEFTRFSHIANVNLFILRILSG